VKNDVAVKSNKKHSFNETRQMFNTKYLLLLQCLIHIYEEDTFFNLFIIII